MSVKQSAAKVYVVDDDSAVRGSIKLLVQAFGFEAESYGSAEAFLDAYKPNESGCLILDLHMPSMNGVELLQQLAARGLSIPTVIITATPDDPLAFLAKKAGVLGLLAKPINAQELQRTIKQALDETEESP